MSRRLGKKHYDYIGDDGINALKHTKSYRNPKVRLFDMYRVKVLLTETYMRDLYWSPQQRCRQGISKDLKPSKMKLYQKLGRYFDRSHTGK